MKSNAEIEKLEKFIVKYPKDWYLICRTSGETINIEEYRRLVEILRENNLNQMIYVLATCHYYIVEQNIDIILKNLLNMANQSKTNIDNWDKERWARIYPQQSFIQTKQSSLNKIRSQEARIASRGLGWNPKKALKFKAKPTPKPNKAHLIPSRSQEASICLEGFGVKPQKSLKIQSLNQKQQNALNKIRSKEASICLEGFGVKPQKNKKTSPVKRTCSTILSELAII